jgi:hypothetical protein
MFQEIADKNREGMALAAFPYQIGIFLGVSSAIASIPLVSQFVAFFRKELPGRY